MTVTASPRPTRPGGVGGDLVEGGQILPTLDGALATLVTSAPLVEGLAQGGLLVLNQVAVVAWQDAHREVRPAPPPRGPSRRPAGSGPA